MTNIVTKLQSKATAIPQKVAAVFLHDGKNEYARLTYEELEHKARAIAAYLQSKKLFGKRVLLLYPAGIDFITTFIGCLYAGVVPVPINCPTVEELEKSSLLLNTIAVDAAISGIFTVAPYVHTLQKLQPAQYFIIDSQELIHYRKYKTIKLKQTDIAYLQYTSGSTSTPKGAVIQHRQLTHSLMATIKAWHYNEESITLNWAPHSHVYGLVCGILLPLYHGSLAVFMPPAAFIKRPLNWLEAINTYRATHAGCPNFGYDLCVQDTPNDDIQGLDLSCWKVAVNGGDAVQTETLIKFVEKFSAYGFNLNQFCPAYGMSELSGAIASHMPGKNVMQVNLSLGGLQHNNVELADQSSPHHQFSALGKLLDGIEAEIVDPTLLKKAGKHKIGEIWLSGKSVAAGYWQKPAETKEIFHATLMRSKKKYFRTGDLGFILNKELYITGRLKELLIVHGKKYYPTDIEKLIEKELSTLAIDDISIAITDANHDIVILQEIDRPISNAEQKSIKQHIRGVIRKNFGIELRAIEFVKKNSIPKTSSGKLKRALCQQLYQENKMELYKFNETTEIEFINLVSSVLNINPEDVDFTAPVSSYAFDSINIIKLSAKLNEQYSVNLSPAILFEYKTLKDFYDDLSTRYLNSANTLTKPLLSKKDSPLEKDIAIIGIAGMFPGANNVDEFWQNLISEKEVIKEIPKERWDWQQYSASTKWGGFLDDIAKFDAHFFNIAPREAELMDPQQRLLLQTVWKTIEDAGYTPKDLEKTKPVSLSVYLKMIMQNY